MRSEIAIASLLLDYINETSHTNIPVHHMYNIYMSVVRARTPEAESVSAVSSNPADSALAVSALCLCQGRGSKTPHIGVDTPIYMYKLAWTPALAL